MSGKESPGGRDQEGCCADDPVSESANALKRATQVLRTRGVSTALSAMVVSDEKGSPRKADKRLRGVLEWKGRRSPRAITLT